LRENAGNPRSTVTALRFFLPEISPGSHYLAKWQAIEENRIPGYNHAVGEASHNPRKSPQAHHVLASFEFRQYETSDADYFLDLPSPGKRAFSLLLPQRVFSIRTGAPRSFRRKRMPERGYSVTGLDPDRTVKCSGRELRISTKASVEVCRRIREIQLSDA